jgi:putative hemolysin
LVTAIIVLLILIILNAFFSASEMALVSLNDTKIKLMADEGNKKAKLVVNLLQEPSKFLATIQIGITLAGFLASAFAASNFAGPLAAWLSEMGVPLDRGLLETIATIVITLLLSYFTLVLGELVPKRIALQKAEAIAFFAVSPLSILSKITSPIVKFLTFSTNVIVRMFGIDPNAEEENVTEEEIRMMVDVGKEKGTILEAEKLMINNIFDFDNKTVSDIMTHRTKMVAIPVHSTLKDIVHTINVEKYTRFPVYETNIDQIIGILHVKDLIYFLENGDRENFDLRTMIREPYFVLESTPLNILFKEMQKNNIHMAIAIDEYGGTDGIVTIEDLLEEIVGNIFDEYDDPESEMKELEQVDENSYLMAGTLNLYEVEDVLRIDMPEEYDTLSGFIIGQLGFIPGADDHPSIKYKNYEFTVDKMDDRRILRVKVTKLVEENVQE